jgi:hypothetical protein
VEIPEQDEEEEGVENGVTAMSFTSEISAKAGRNWNLSSEGRSSRRRNEFVHRQSSLPEFVFINNSSNETSQKSESKTKNVAEISIFDWNELRQQN